MSGSGKGQRPVENGQAVPEALKFFQGQGGQTDKADESVQRHTRPGRQLTSQCAG